MLSSSLHFLGSSESRRHSGCPRYHCVFRYGCHPTFPKFIFDDLVSKPNSWDTATWLAPQHFIIETVPHLLVCNVLRLSLNHVFQSETFWLYIVHRVSNLDPLMHFLLLVFYLKGRLRPRLRSLPGRLAFIHTEATVDTKVPLVPLVTPSQAVALFDLFYQLLLLFFIGFELDLLRMRLSLHASLLLLSTLFDFLQFFSNVLGRLLLDLDYLRTFQTCDPWFLSSCSHSLLFNWHIVFFHCQRS